MQEADEKEQLDQVVDSEGEEPVDVSFDERFHNAEKPDSQIGGLKGRRISPIDFQGADKVHGESSRRVGRDRAEAAVVVRGVFLGEIAPCTNDEVWESQLLADLADGGAFHFHEIGLEFPLDSLDAGLRLAEEITGADDSGSHCG